MANLVDVPDPEWEETQCELTARLMARERSGELATLAPEVRKAAPWQG